MKGIYLIVNKLNGHKYVGRSVDITNRWKQHIYSSKRGDGFYIHKVIAKYGVENFIFSVLEETEELYEREVHWYYKLKPEYNELPPDLPPCSMQLKPVKSMDVKTREIIHYTGVKEAARQNNISKTAITNVIRGTRNTAAGKYWAFEENEFIEKPDRGNNGSRRIRVTIKKGKFTKTFNSKSEAAKYMGVSIGALRHKNCFGYKIILNNEPVETIPLIGK
jgi:hypothetical protein